MSLDQISNNNTVQLQPQLQLGQQHDNHQSALPYTSKEVAQQFLENLPAGHSSEESPISNPLRRFCAFLSRISFKFQSFFSPGNSAKGEKLPFPFELSYQIQTDEAASNGSSTRPTHKIPHSQMLAHLADTRQGLLQITTGQEKGIAHLLTKLMASPKFSEGISLTDTKTIVGLELKEQTPDSRQWGLLIHDAEEDETIKIPLTEVLLKNRESSNLLNNLTLVQQEMDQHFRAINTAYQDSVQQPVVICEEQPQLARLAVAHMDLLSRMYKGQIENFDQMTGHANDVLEMISPGRSLFRNEVEKRAFYQVLMERFEDNRFKQLTGVEMDPAHQIRASRRHVPAPDFPITAVPWGVVKTMVGANPETPIEPEMPTVAPALVDVSTPTLAGKKPLTKPSLLLKPIAYKEPLKQDLCTVNSVNTFFQNEVTTPEKMAKTVIESMRGTGLDLSGLHGLGHPDLVAAVERGETITIRKADFLGPTPHEIPAEDLLHNNTPAQQWQNIINVSKPLGPGKDWVDNADELNGIERLTITPSDWLSANSGVGIDLLEGTINSILETAKDDPTWDHMPEEVLTHHLGGATEDERKAKIKALVKQINVNCPIYMSMQQEYQMVVLKGSGKHGGNHFYTIAYNKPNDNWISLNSDATRDKGVQDCKVFCENDKLEQKLLDGVYAVLVPKPYLAVKPQVDGEV